MSVLVELGQHLQTAAVGTLGTDIFLGFMPDSPDIVMSLYEYAGSGPEDTFGVDDLPYNDKLNIQVRARGTLRGYQEAHDKATAIFGIFTKIANEDIGGGYYFRVRKINGPYLLYVDQQDRPIIVCNYEVWRRP